LGGPEGTKIGGTQPRGVSFSTASAETANLTFCRWMAEGKVIHASHQQG
jgi:hypothetical protein